MPLNILIVDDSSTLRKIIRRCVTQTEIKFDNIYEASDGEEALGLMGQNPVDIVLSDINMPKMNGIELLTAIKGDDKYKNTAVLMITTEARAETVLDAAQKGAVGYIKKPFTPSEIQDQLMPVLKGRAQ